MSEYIAFAIFYFVFGAGVGCAVVKREIHTGKLSWSKTGDVFLIAVSAIGLAYIWPLYLMFGEEDA